MTILKGPEFVKKINAKRYFNDEVAKLNTLSIELVEGRASEADMAYWEDSLSRIEDYLDYLEKKEKDIYIGFQEEYTWLEHKVRALRFKEYDVPYLVSSSLLGLFNSLVKQREVHEEKGDLVIVMGNWMGYEGDKESIYKAMDLIEEGVIVLRGSNEELYIDNNDESSREVKFLKSLPTDVQSEDLIVTTGNSKNEPVQMEDFIKSDVPNLTGKTIVTVHPIEGEGSTHDSERTIIMVAPGDAIKLNLNEKDREEIARQQQPLNDAQQQENAIVGDLSQLDSEVLEELERLKSELAENMEHEDN